MNEPDGAVREHTGTVRKFRKPLAEGNPFISDAQPGLRVFIPDENASTEEKAHHFPLRIGQWEQVKLPLPANWRGAGLLLVPSGEMIEVARVRIVSEVMGEVVWQMSGQELGKQARSFGGAQIESHPRLLRLRHAENIPQVLLPDIDLGDFDEPLRLEIGLRASAEKGPVAEASGTTAVQTRPVYIVSDWLAAERALRAERADALELCAAAESRATALQAQLDAVRAEATRAASLHEQSVALRGALTACWDFLQGVDTELKGVLKEADEQARDAHTALATAQEQARETLARLETTRNQLLDTEAELRELHEEKRRWQQDEEFLRQEIAGMQQELQALDESLASVTRQQSEAQAALNEARRRGEDDHGRVRSMQRSASWKMTLPLRAAHRLMSGRHAGQRNGAAAAARSQSLPTDAELARGNGGYRFQLDQPASWELPTQQARLRGWCLPPAESDRPVPALRVRYGEHALDVPCDLPRPDVLLEIGGHPEWRTCGFDAAVDFPGGPSQVVIEAVDESGQSWLVGQYKVRAPYAAWSEPAAGTGDPAHDYAAWIERFERLTVAERRQLRARARTLAYKPLISVVMPVYNTPEAWLVRAIDSVRRQLYPFWELCIADDHSPQGQVKEVLERYARQDPRIKIAYRESNGHIAAASNTALGLAQGEFVALLDHDDELPVQALYAVALELQEHPDADVLYSDEDKIDEHGKRFAPYFKPDWNPDLLLGQNFVSHLGVYRREVINRAGGFRLGYEGCQDWDLVLRITEQIPAARIRHIPRILYHWRAIVGSTARDIGEKDYIVDASRRVLRDHCERTGKDAEILPVAGSHFRVRHRLPAPQPLVSIIIPTHNQLAVLRQGIETLRAKTTYPHYELLVVDNRSDDPGALAYLDQLQSEGLARVLRYPEPFNYSAINNFAVEQAAGELVCLMNNDMEVITPDWLEEMASQALRPGIGAVGAILYYPDDTIQHAGVVLGIGGVAGHIFSRLPRGTDGYFNRARIVQNLTAVTAACLVIRRATYQQVGGLNETLKVAFNDVDFCLKVRAAGFRNLWTPHAEFYHHESVSRGAEDTNEKYRRFVGEVDYMQAHWHALIEADPAYNLNLSTVGGQCHLGNPPRVAPLPALAAPVETAPAPTMSTGVFSH